MEGDSVWYKGKNSFKGRSRPDFPPPPRSWNHHGQVASPDGFRLQNGADYPAGCCYRRTHSSPQNTERYARPAGWSCGCRQAPALHSPSQWPSPLWCHSWWHPRFIFISSSLKKKKMWQLLNLNPPKQAFFSPVYLPVLPEKIILKEQFPWLCPEGRELEGLLQFAVNVETGPFRDMTLTLELHTGKWLLVDISFHVKGHVRRNKPEKQLIPHHPQITLSQQLPTS